MSSAVLLAEKSEKRFQVAIMAGNYFVFCLVSTV